MRASFDGPARAVRCASALAERPARLRAGVHTGECELRGGAVSGAALEIAAGVARGRTAGEILATSTVHDLVACRRRVRGARRRRAPARGRLAGVAAVRRRPVDQPHLPAVYPANPAGTGGVSCTHHDADHLHDPQRRRHAAAVRDARRDQRPARARRVPVPRREPVARRRAQPHHDQGLLRRRAARTPRAPRRSRRRRRARRSCSAPTPARTRPSTCCTRSRRA